MRKCIITLVLLLCFNVIPSYAYTNVVSVGKGYYIAEENNTIYLNGKKVSEQDIIIGRDKDIIVLGSGAYKIANNNLERINKEMVYDSSYYSKKVEKLPIEVKDMKDSCLDDAGNIWVLTKNLILKYNENTNLLDAKYSLTTEYTNISVSDDETVVVWNVEDSSYWTNSNIKLYSANDGWYKENGKWRFSDYTDEFVQHGESWYYIGSDGYMVTGWFQRKGKWYYASERGVLTTLKEYKWEGLSLFDGWRYENDEWVYYKEGKRI